MSDNVSYELQQIRQILERIASATPVAPDVNVTVEGGAGGVSDGDKGALTVAGDVWTLNPRVVTPAEFSAIPHDHLVGRYGSGTGDVQAIGITGGLELSGSNIRRAALTGDVTAAAGSNAMTITPAANPSWVTSLAWTKLTGVPSTFAPSSHTHPLSELLQSGATTGQVAQWNGTAWAPFTPVAVDYQIFTSGSGNWTNPSPSIRRIGKFRIVGGAGGGGSGRKGATGSVRCGGGGGGAGATHEQWFWTDLMPATVAYVVGQGGAGGAAQAANSTNGNTGANGGSSSWGMYQAGSGSGGAGGTTNSGTGGAGLTNGNLLFVAALNSQAGTSASATGASVNGTGILAPIPTGGAPGGGVTSANSASAGGQASISGSGTHGTTSQVLGGPANTGLAGTTPPANSLFSLSGRGGTGGGGSTVGNAGAGSPGVGPGGGGGGGGAATDAVGNSGAGGAGADGMVEIIVY